MNDIFDTIINFMKCVINQKLIQVKQYFRVSQRQASDKSGGCFVKKRIILQI